MAEAHGKSKGGGMMGLLIPLIAVTLVGGGGGAFLGMSLLAPKEPEKAKAAGEGVQSAGEKSGGDEKSGHAKAEDKAPAHGEGKAEAHGSAHGSAHGEAKPDPHGDKKDDKHAKSDAHGDDGAKTADLPPDLRVKELPSLVTNLGGEHRNWVRLQSAIVYDAHETEHPEALFPAIMSDITAFMSTVDVSSIEGADGLRRLQEELGERAATRSERHVKEFIIESLVVQ